MQDQNVLVESDYNWETPYNEWLWMLDSGEGCRWTTCGQDLFLDLNESVQLLPEIMYLIDLWLANGREEIGLAPHIVSYAEIK